jgi:hypothetical protein
MKSFILGRSAKMTFAAVGLLAPFLLCAKARLDVIEFSS